MVIRSEMDTNNKKYQPLHRLQDYNQRERILLKYTEQMVWYSDKQLGDPYRNWWKTKIPTNNQSLKSSRDEREITSVLFVPPSRDSELLRLVREKDKKLRDISWRIKILEQSGVPLLMSFGRKFPLKDGCQRGSDCIQCGNTGVKCSSRGVVYHAKCQTCKESVPLEKCNDQATVIGSNNISCYVGETSRPVRERIYEHMKP